MRRNLRSQTLADGIVDFELLDFNYGADRRQLRVRKLRGCSYFSGTHDFNIVTGGLVVFPRLIARVHAEIPYSESLSSGVVQIDALLSGGLPRGSCTLVMGPAGSEKSTITTVYAMAAAKRGEHCSILLFDESPESHIARSQGLGFDIAAAIEAGRIRVKDLGTVTVSVLSTIFLPQQQQRHAAALQLPWTCIQSGSGRAGFSSNVVGVNSRRSSSPSSIPSGIGQLIPITAARRKYSPTVDRVTPTVFAICRSLTPSACFGRRTSRTFRIGALSAGSDLPSLGRKGRVVLNKIMERWRGQTRDSTARCRPTWPQLLLISDPAPFMRS
jgi:hypothetical protein